MKQCPTCLQVYQDESLNFCLSDGSPLSSGSHANETETVVLPPRSIPPGNAGRQGVSPVFAYVTIGLLALAVGGGIVFWMQSYRNPETNTRVSQTPQPQTSPTIYVTSSSVPPSNVQIDAPQIDASAARQEVQTSLNGWLATINNRDLSRRLDYYASRLERYYTKTNVGISMVRTENEKAFDKFSSLNMSISNVSTSVDSSTGEVTTTFDKSFNFQGSTNYFEGAVKSEFRWRKIGGVWKIISERDLKVYHVNKSKG